MLSDANKRWHEALDTSYQLFLESLTALELSLATRQRARFKILLTRHIEFEETHIEPLAKNWESNTLKLIQSDHLILERLLPKLNASLDTIRQADKPRTILVHQLNNFIKMRNVLEHHDIREMEYLYPLHDAQLDKTRCTTLANKMDKAREAL